MTSEKYKSRFHRSGAMIEEMLVLIQNYNPTIPQNEWVEYVIANNLLGKPSRSWVREVIVSSFYPRYVKGKFSNSWKEIKIFQDAGFNINQIKPLLYYFTAKYDRFLYDFTTKYIFERFFSGFLAISAKDVYNFIEQLPDSAFNQQWSDYVKKFLK